ncbi:MAG: helix-turn-helix domain-containing protein [Elusimicrobia bacterium]|nr:helix-turn-helix domain-containing protein [Elusimicrobiota bacterium]
MAQYLSLPKATIYTWVSLRKIPGVVKLGRSLRFDLEVVDRWVKERRVSQEPVLAGK